MPANAIRSRQLGLRSGPGTNAFIVSGSPRDVETGPHGRTLPHRKAWTPSGKPLKSRQMMGGTPGRSSDNSEACCNRWELVGLSQASANGVNASAHPWPRGEVGGTLGDVLISALLRSLRITFARQSWLWSCGQRGEQILESRFVQQSIYGATFIVEQRIG